MRRIRPVLAALLCLLLPSVAAARGRVVVLPLHGDGAGPEARARLERAIHEGLRAAGLLPVRAGDGGCDGAPACVAETARRAGGEAGLWAADRPAGDSRSLLLLWAPVDGAPRRDAGPLPARGDELERAVRDRIVRWLAPERWLGAIELLAMEGSDVWLDGDRIGSTPLPEPLRVEPGQHLLRVVRGAGEARAYVEVRYGRVTRVRIEPRSDQVELVGFAEEPPAPVPAPAHAPAAPAGPERSGPAVWPRWALLGAGVAALGLGLVPAADAAALRRERASLRDADGNFPPDALEEQRALRRRHDQRRTLSWILFGAGGAMVLGAGALFAWDAADSEIGLEVGPDGAAVAGRF